MALVDSLRSLLADPYRKGSLAARARERRWQMLLHHFPDLHQMRVVDLGGTPGYWRASPLKPAHVTVINREAFEPIEGVDVVVGDACDPPPSLGIVDLVFSNSLVEHLGGYERRRLFADVVRGLAPRYWIQTPYRYFPIEPHWLFPGFQFLPLRLRVALTGWWPLGHIHGRGLDALELTLGVELIDRTELAFLFPDGKILFERFWGLPKSLIAIRE